MPPQTEVTPGQRTHHRSRTHYRSLNCKWRLTSAPSESRRSGRTLQLGSDLILRLTPSRNGKTYVRNARYIRTCQCVPRTRVATAPLPQECSSLCLLHLTIALHFTRRRPSAPVLTTHLEPLSATAPHKSCRGQRPWPPSRLGFTSSRVLSRPATPVQLVASRCRIQHEPSTDSRAVYIGCDVALTGDPGLVNFGNEWRGLGGKSEQREWESSGGRGYELSLKSSPSWLRAGRRL
jgi:hypothetical protein